MCIGDGLEGVKNETLFDEVDLDRPPTEPGSGVHSPFGSGPIELRTKLGEGSFGIVWHVWDVTMGEQIKSGNPFSPSQL